MQIATDMIRAHPSLEQISVPIVLYFLGISPVTKGVGRPREISAEQEAALVKTTLHSTPQDATHWSVHSMAKTQGVSSASVQRIWKKHHLQPHRVEKFKFSTDPQFVPKSVVLLVSI
jgi:hypothetical protein